MRPVVAPKRVVVFVSGLGSGGAERTAVHICGWLLAAGHEVSLLTLSAEQADFYKTPEGVFRTGLDLQRPSHGLIAPVLANFRRWLAVRRYVRARGANVVLSLGDRSNVLMLLATLGVDCRKIISDRTDPVSAPLTRGWGLLRRVAYPLATLHIAQSKYVVAWIDENFPGLCSTVIGNAATMTSSGGVRADSDRSRPFELIAVGRLTRAKGIDLLLKSFALARNETDRELRLTLVGDGEDRAALEDHAKEMGLGCDVRFAGRVPDVATWLCKADAYVLSSRWEGFPNALIEAMAVGLPVIAARCRGGVEDILGDEKERYGLEFSPGNVEELADCIVRMAMDDELRQRLARCALERAADYSSERVASAWREVVERP